jgi:hypothetical protein
LLCFWLTPLMVVVVASELLWQSSSITKGMF